MKSVLRNPLNPDKREVYNAFYIENAAMLGKSILLCKCGEMKNISTDKYHRSIYYMYESRQNVDNPTPYEYS